MNNLKRAWEFLCEHVDEAVDWSFVSHYNTIIGIGSIANPDKLRTIPVRIGGTDWTPNVPTIESARACIGDASLLHDPESRAVVIFLAISRGQWFANGNKRTLLMVANHCLINAGVGIFSVAPRVEARFYTAFACVL
ncbi:MAG: hypothetical protein ABF780_04915 [Bifidobacterium aquikefiri]|uniref:hypothetical protein n=1 Tax=Bifidobacterium aquikefiri TaxID=1653207 RepID=UPI001302F413|nr:hypothetical protein [Bifidobacterium aquikefiri]